MTVGGLSPATACWAVGEEEMISFETDGQGCWNGPLPCGIPLCIVQQGKPVLFDGSRTDREGAAQLYQYRIRPPQRQPEPPENAKPEKAAEETEQAEATADSRIPETPAAYRKPADTPPVDALPELAWPEGTEQLKPYFKKHRPLRLFNSPGWRTVRVQEAGAVYCFGYFARNDRITEVMYGMQARGGMIPPKGLQGYRYERALDGSGYWVLRQRVEEPVR